MNTEKLARALEEVALFHQGKVSLRRTIVTPPPVDVKRIREKVGLSQKEFSETYHLPLGTIRNWEQGARVPEGPARVLLALIERNPEHMKKEIEGLLQAA